MKERYRLFLRRKSVYYAFDNTTKTFESLKTKDKAEATRMMSMRFNDASRGNSGCGCSAYRQAFVWQRSRRS